MKVPFNKALQYNGYDALCKVPMGAREAIQIGEMLVATPGLSWALTWAVELGAHGGLVDKASRLRRGTRCSNHPHCSLVSATGDWFHPKLFPSHIS